MISAQAETDDSAIVLEFDATSFFEQASDEDLIDLAECGWGSDYAADEVAHFMEASGDEQFGKFFAYLAIKNEFRGDDEMTGFEVKVNRGEALDWLTTFRPTVLAQINQQVNEDLDERLGVQAQRLNDLTLDENPPEATK
jgi:hypothetical protein